MPRAEARGGMARGDRDVARRAKSGGFGAVPLGFTLCAMRRAILLGVGLKTLFGTFYNSSDGKNGLSLPPCPQAEELLPAHRSIYLD
jgi:hypothetical protein